MMPRSYLFVPADRPERIAKALASGADAVVVDLEDAVSPQAKPAARDALRSWLAQSGAAVIVRVNACGTEWHAADIALCRDAGVATVMLAKAERTDDVARIAAERRVIPLIETAAGIDNARAIASVSGVERLAFGSIDLALDLAIDGDADELVYFRSHVVLASRLAGRGSPVDGVSAAIDDEALLQRDSERARRLGFGGKLCIHPRQIGIVNRAFMPSDAERAWARRIVEASRASGGAAVAVDGRMVDHPVLLRAQRILEQCDEVERRNDRTAR